MAFLYIPAFLYSQFLVIPPYPTYDFTGQTVIITGANAGLGYDAALHITRLNAKKVILAVRTLSKGEAAKRAIEESTGRKGVVDVWSLDLSSFASVKSFAERASSLERLDVLLENAGGVSDSFEIVEGHERTITTNVISTFMLALMMLPKLRETASKFSVTPRLTIVSSEVHYFTNLPQKAKPSIFEALKNTSADSGMDRYDSLASMTKLDMLTHTSDIQTQSYSRFFTAASLPQQCLIAKSRR